jgi:hypothetical protein
MRFLLNAPKTPSLQQRVKSRIKNRLSKEQTNVRNPVLKESTAIKAWGQQCSPHCGCTVRFEATIDPKDSNKIVFATYDAKTVVTHVQQVQMQNGQVSHLLSPVRTLSNDDSTKSAGGARRSASRPLTKQCKCNTLHSLAHTITEILPNYSLSQAQNQLEYAGIRSSPEFRYSALKHLDLIQNNKDTSEDKKKNEVSSPVNIKNIPEGKCYDLVEEALMACIQGFIPKPRPIIQCNINIVNDKRGVQRVKNNTEETNNGYLDPLRFVTAAKRRAKEGFLQTFQPTSSSQKRSSVPSSNTTNNSSSMNVSSMPPFHLNHDDTHHIDTLTQIKMEIRSMNDQDDERMRKEEHLAWNDWVSYVDELHTARLD